MRWPLTTLLGVTDVSLSSLEATSSSLLKYLFLIVDVLPLITSMSAMSSRYENVWTVLEFVIGFVFTSLTMVTLNRKRKTFMLSFHHSNITITCFKTIYCWWFFFLEMSTLGTLNKAYWRSCFPAQQWLESEQELCVALPD